MKNICIFFVPILILSLYPNLFSSAQCIDLTSSAYIMGFETTDNNLTPWIFEDDGALGSDGYSTPWRVLPALPNSTNWGPRTGERALIYQWNDSYAANDWAFTPCFSVTSGRNYEIRFWYAAAATSSGTIYSEKLEIGLGSAQVSNFMTQIYDLGTITNVYPNYIEYVLPFTASTTEDIVLGFHVYSDANQYIMQVDDVSITDVSSIGIQEFGLNAYINLSPNPTRNQLNIEFNLGEFPGNMNIEILGLDGRTIHQATVNTIEGLNQESVDVSALAEGIYFVHLSQGKRKITQKFVVRY